jgi:tellurite resistance protein TerC
MWGGFLLFVLLLLALDLGVFNKRAHAPSIKEALAFAAMTAALAMCFAGFIYEAYELNWLGLGSHVDAVDGQLNGGRLAMVKFVTGYIVELSLSMDNVFVIALIFQHLKVPVAQQHRVLFWGIIGALAMRGTMIGGGATLVTHYHWVLYLFGAFLVYTAGKMLMSGPREQTPEESAVVHWLNRHFQVTRDFHGSRFHIRKDGRRFVTPLFIALVLVESTDLLFAVDSIPAIFAVTSDPFLVFTSNVFAILCLRSLYFGLAGFIDRLRYLKTSLALVLGIVGLKMLGAARLNALLGDRVNYVMLAVIVMVLVGGAAASLVADKRASPS